MITTTGKDILAKYLVGQAPAYASYIAIGCGAKPLNTGAVLDDYSDKKALDLEMFRVPVTSRGYVNEDGVDKIVFTAELPTEERYEITEVGVYSAGANPAAANFDSRTIYSFTDSENWEWHRSTDAISIPIIYEPLDAEFEDNIILPKFDLNGNGTIDAGTAEEDLPVFQTNADNRIFTEQGRVERYERCRFLNNMIVMRGDQADLSVDGSGNIVYNSGNHIHLNGISINLDRNAPTDELKFAFSLVNKDGNTPVSKPDRVLILVEFASTDQTGIGEFARLEVDIEDTEGDEIFDFDENRYFVVTKKLQDLVKSSGFSWDAIAVAKIYVSVLDDGGNPSSDYYVAIDALRFENVTTQNPLYGLTGYSVIKNTDAETIVKTSNTTNFVEFRFAVGVQ